MRNPIDMTDPGWHRRDIIVKALAHLDHVLPAQAPIADFVHHNTLHGYQHLPFEEALAACEKLTGISAYLPETQSREFYWNGRINDSDLADALHRNPRLQAEQVALVLPDKTIQLHDIYKVALLFDLPKITLSQLNWYIEELRALDTLQEDVQEPIRNEWLALFQSADKSAKNPIRQLWEILCNRLKLTQTALHPENLLDLNLQQMEQWLETSISTASVHEKTQDLAKTMLGQFFADLGESQSLRGIFLSLTGKDVLDAIRPQLIKLCASAMDEGVAAWQLPECNRIGLYGAWRNIAQSDVYPFINELPDWPNIMAELPEDAIDNIILQLEYFEIPPTQWAGYLRRLALEIPGWSGMINWRQQHPKYYTASKVIPKLEDYLAIRLTLDRLWLNQISRETWKIDTRLTALQRYFSKNLSEFVVRCQWHQGKLPEYLTQQAVALSIRAMTERQCRPQWQHLADLIYTWNHSPLADNQNNFTVNNSGWRLFRLCQHLGLKANEVSALTQSDLHTLLEVLDGFDTTARNQVWLQAYERHYREDLFQALRGNHKRGRWAKREKSPEVQIVFCMDEREESFRRHLEEHNPAIETLGAAGFFGVAMNYKGMDDDRVIPLCPIVVTPAHEVQELPQDGEASSLSRHQRGRKLNHWLGHQLHHGLRRSLVASQVIINLIAPVTLLGLLAKALSQNGRIIG